MNPTDPTRSGGYPAPAGDLTDTPAAPTGPAPGTVPPAVDCEASWDGTGTNHDHRCDLLLDHRSDHECGCQAQAPQCRAEYAPERRDPTARIVRCDLPAGHDGAHQELYTTVTWPQTAVPATAVPATPGQLDIDAIEHRAHHHNLLCHQIGSYTPELAKAAEASADDVPQLLAELRRVSGQLVERTDRLMETLHKRNELAERLELAEEAEAGASGMLRDARRQLETWRTRALAAETATPGVHQLPAGITWNVLTWHCARCEKRSTWTTQGGAVDPLTEATAEAFGHHANHVQWDAERLSTTPPAGTRHPLPPELANAQVQFWVCPVPGHSDRRGPNGRPVVTVEWDGDVAHCTAPGCLRTSEDPPGGRGSCECELYDCTGGCCGPGQCSCSTGAFTTPPAGTEGEHADQG